MKVSIDLFVATYTESSVGFCHPDAEEVEGWVFCWIPKSMLDNFDDIDTFDTTKAITIVISGDLAVEKNLDSYCEELEDEA